MHNSEYPLDHIRSRLPDVVGIKPGEDKIFVFRFPGDEDEEIPFCFEIEFFLKFDRRELPDDEETITRIIRCLDQERAKCVALHMLGEEVWPGKTLVDVIEIRRVNPQRLSPKEERAAITKAFLDGRRYS